MIRPAFVLSAILATCCVQAQETVNPAELIQSAKEFIEQNVDDEVLSEMGVDEEQVQRVLTRIQERFAGEYVFDLSAIGETATNLLPVLKGFEETVSYASWLEARLDYFTTLEELQREATATNRPAAKPLNPSPAVERRVWKKTLSKRPIPPRAARYVSRLKPIFESKQVPPELVWMAEVESSFDPSARSPAGAAGLFQLMPATAKSLELSLWPRDERLQPEKNARAAATYLRQLHKRFGDWPLALAAYNAGETRVASLLKKHGAKDFDGIATRLPAETQFYVPKIEATVLEREGRELSDLK